MCLSWWRSNTGSPPRDRVCLPSPTERKPSAHLPARPKCVLQLMHSLSQPVQAWTGRVDKKIGDMANYSLLEHPVSAELATTRGRRGDLAEGKIHHCPSRRVLASSRDRTSPKWCCCGQLHELLLGCWEGLLGFLSEP